MTDGTSQGLFIVVAIVIFGIFVLLAYILFEDTLSPAMASMFTDATEQAQERLDEGKLIYQSYKEIDASSDTYSNTASEYEYVQHSLDFSKIAKEHGEGDYTLKFDMKQNQNIGTVAVYALSGDNREYTMGYKVVRPRLEYKTFILHIQVEKTDEHPGSTTSQLSFWGGGNYNSEIFPSVKNVKLYKGHVGEEVLN